MDDSSPGTSFALLPEVEARALLAGRQLTFRLLHPPYAALGVGVLRVLRLRDCGAGHEMTAGYESYERLPGAAAVPR